MNKSHEKCFKKRTKVTVSILPHLGFKKTFRISQTVLNIIDLENRIKCSTGGHFENGIYNTVTQVINPTM